ncbi:MAG: hypothetical protein E3J64_00350 [Anaerolineales bacterium]|nr:MAG: hypothetical protein E3J64_00350 [Anaerolineales bacterium]
MNIGLVSCTKRKLDHACPARELYSASALFRKARAYCERHYDAWYILSAKHDLVHPGDDLAPYDVTLKRMGVADRRAWGRRVSADLRALGDHVFYAHAGKDYLEYIAGVNLVNVLEGLTFGQRLRWYNEQAAKEG